METCENKVKVVPEETARPKIMMTGRALKRSSAVSPLSLSHLVVIMLAITCGVAVANVYYAQPLLASMAHDFGIPEASIGVVITITQLCYASGLLLLVPLGDLVNRRLLIVCQLLLSALALAVVASTSIFPMWLVGIGIVGLLATVTQAVVACAAALAAPAQRGQVVGLVTSGVVIGILLARTVAGTLADLAGWRSVYIVSAILALLMAGILFRALPSDKTAKASLSYPQLLRSVFVLFGQEPLLRIRAIIAMLIFAAFSTLWTSMTLPLSATPFSFSHTVIGAFGLVGVAGALAAKRAGSLADRGLEQWTTGIGLALLLVSWLPISLLNHSLLAVIVGIILLDLAVQAVHVTNQSMIYRLRPEALSRLAASYMIFYSIGSGTGSIASTLVYVRAGWIGVSVLGAAISAVALLFWALTRSRARVSK
ncbi:putative MFS family arabinose efflux permease [Thermosporothrix hazakensis]|jgi:predicted MFS family arabinose efflux permease|uniref:Putative MFS family arabinose efflux permease n=1 Tax=Thermosporothrix hazakensis TaxID=644383 RepID=A0A326U2W3_THEHA|nr:putative MFS family arabinose efflux permease [Thermosporothrix hazakensis]